MKAFAKKWKQVLAVVLLLASAACTAPQIQSNVQTLPLKLTKTQLDTLGMAIITPSTVTGQEEDKQALALSFFEILRAERPSLRVVSLPVTLSAINREGFGNDYRRLLDDYRLTGLLDQLTLQRVGQAAGVRYIAQLKLAGFRQESKDRWGVFGLRVFQTKSSVVRLFLQVWDCYDGSVAWEGTVELTASYDSIDEGTVTFRSAIEESARRLIKSLP